MEFENNTPASDEDRRLAEAKQVTITPLHSEVAPEPPSEAEVITREQNRAPQANSSNDIEHTDQTQLVQPTQSALQKETAAVSNKHFLAAFFFSFFWGTFGIDRFYLGKVGTGILKLLTFGGMGLWTIIDLVLIMSGSMRDRHDRQLAGYIEYKKLALTTTLVAAIVTGAFILISGIASIYTLTNLYQQYQNGQFQVPTMPSEQTLPDINQL
jgi:hypothetical protein